MPATKKEKKEILPIEEIVALRKEIMGVLAQFDKFLKDIEKSLEEVYKISDCLGLRIDGIFSKKLKIGFRKAWGQIEIVIPINAGGITQTLITEDGVEDLQVNVTPVKKLSNKEFTQYAIRVVNNMEAFAEALRRFLNLAREKINELKGDVSTTTSEETTVQKLAAEL